MTDAPHVSAIRARASGSPTAVARHGLRLAGRRAVCRPLGDQLCTLDASGNPPDVVGDTQSALAALASGGYPDPAFLE
jgi:hypothetical protein